MTRDQIMQNKIYRAVHDGVCPSCGSDLRSEASGAECDVCGFDISTAELLHFRAGVVAWGKEVDEYVQEWRTRMATGGSQMNSIDLTGQQSRDELHRIKQNMKRYGGHFATKLAELMDIADGSNQKILLAAFADVFKKYANKDFDR